MFSPAVNYEKGRSGNIIQYIILYSTRTTGLHSTVEICQTESEERSYHFIVGRAGDVIQTVRVIDTAWHASGVPIPDINYKSISIALVGTGVQYSMAQYVSVSLLCSALTKLFGIGDDNIVGYDELMGSNGIICPGPNFCWNYLFLQIHNECCGNLNKNLVKVSVPIHKMGTNFWGSGR